MINKFWVFTLFFPIFRILYESTNFDVNFWYFVWINECWSGFFDILCESTCWQNYPFCFTPATSLCKATANHKVALFWRRTVSSMGDLQSLLCDTPTDDGGNLQNDKEHTRCNGEASWLKLCFNYTTNQIYITLLILPLCINWGNLIYNFFYKKKIINYEHINIFQFLNEHKHNFF